MFSKHWVGFSNSDQNRRNNLSFLSKASQHQHPSDLKNKGFHNLLHQVRQAGELLVPVGVVGEALLVPPEVRQRGALEPGRPLEMGQLQELEAVLVPHTGDNRLLTLLLQLLPRRQMLLYVRLPALDLRLVSHQIFKAFLSSTILNQYFLCGR